MKIIASQKDGRVVPWFLDSNPPNNYVEVPDELYEQYKNGKIKDGFELAQKSLAVKAGYKVPQAKPAIKIPVVSEEAAPAFPEVLKMRT